jgi:Holliday junction resolvase RusA-like endonuclease
MSEIARLPIKDREASDSLIVRLAGPPMGKERVRITRQGRAYTPERTVTYEGRLAYAAQQAMQGRPLFDGAVAVEIVALMPIPASWSKKRQQAAREGRVRPTTKPDSDNIAKLLDSLNLIVWGDDAQIVDLGKVSKHYSDTPALVIHVSAAPEKSPIPEWAVHDVEDIFA